MSHENFLSDNKEFDEILEKTNNLIKKYDELKASVIIHMSEIRISNSADYLKQCCVWIKNQIKNVPDPQTFSDPIAAVDLKEVNCEMFLSCLKENYEQNDEFINKFCITKSLEDIANRLDKKCSGLEHHLRENKEVDSCYHNIMRHLEVLRNNQPTIPSNQRRQSHQPPQQSHEHQLQKDKEASTKLLYTYGRNGSNNSKDLRPPSYTTNTSLTLQSPSSNKITTRSRSRSKENSITNIGPQDNNDNNNNSNNCKREEEAMYNGITNTTPATNNNTISQTLSSHNKKYYDDRQSSEETEIQDPHMLNYHIQSDNYYDNNDHDNYNNRLTIIQNKVTSMNLIDSNLNNYPTSYDYNNYDNIEEEVEVEDTQNFIEESVVESTVKGEVESGEDMDVTVIVDKKNQLTDINYDNNVEWMDADIINKSNNKNYLKNVNLSTNSDSTTRTSGISTNNSILGDRITNNSNSSSNSNSNCKANSRKRALPISSTDEDLFEASAKKGFLSNFHSVPTITTTTNTKGKRKESNSNSTNSAADFFANHNQVHLIQHKNKNKNKNSNHKDDIENDGDFEECTIPSSCNSTSIEMLVNNTTIPLSYLEEENEVRAKSKKTHLTRLRKNSNGDSRTMSNNKDDCKVTNSDEVQLLINCGHTTTQFKNENVLDNVNNSKKHHDYAVIDLIDT